MSTSCLAEVDDLLKDKFREEMRKDSTKVPVHMEIDIPAGRGWGAYIAPNSMPQYKNQCEFLLARGTKLEITKVEQRPADPIFGKPHYYIKCKVIENNPKDVTKLDHQQFHIKSESLSVIDARLLKSALLDVALNKDDPLYRFVENGFTVATNSADDKSARRVIWN